MQVLTGNQPFPNREDDEIKDEVVRGHRPPRPTDLNEIKDEVVRGNRPPRPTDLNEPLSEDAKRWLSDDVWEFICLCWYEVQDYRPDVDKVIEALKKAVKKDRSKSGRSGSKQSLLKRAVGTFT